MNKNINEDFSNAAFEFFTFAVPIWAGLIGSLLSMMGLAAGGSKLKSIIENLLNKFVVSHLKKDNELIDIINTLEQLKDSSQESNMRRNMLYRKAETRVLSVFQNSGILQALRISPDKQTQFLNSLRSQMKIKDFFNRNSSNNIDNNIQSM
jgi:hypothetical protein